jgi:hypothetical protein
MGLTADYAAKLRELVASADQMSETELLGKALMIGVKWRTQLWVNTLAVDGLRVRSGPFAGMDYVVNAAEGALLPRLLGVYERELHPDLLAFAAEGLDHVIDIGCAEGYYAVGLARLMPGVTINAYDIDETARRRCGLLAKANGVTDRVIVRGEFRGQDFETFRDRGRVLVFIDAEGFEDDILRPDLYPALAGFNLVVETHPDHRAGVTERVMERFAATHDIRRLDPSIEQAQLPPQLTGRSHLDMLLACWEWRAGPTPWLIMRPKAPVSAA